MNVITFVLYVVFAIIAAATIPGVFVITREIVRRWRAKRALEKLVQARLLIHELRGESANCVARTLSRQFDRHTVEAALEEAFSQEAICADICEKLCLRERWERTLRRGRAWNERAHAARMLGKLRSGASSQTLVEALVDPHEDTTVRLAAGQAIANLMDESVIPHLCAALEDDDENSAPTIAETLVSLGELSIDPVIALLGHTRPNTRTWAARILGSIGHSRTTLPLLTALGDADVSTRAAVAEALGRIGDMRAVRALCSLALTDPTVPVRACAAFALAKTGDQEAVRSIVFALRDPNAEVRRRAAEAMAMLAPTDWSALERALFDSCARVRRSAALTLDRLGAVAVWTRALGSPVSQARVTARTALLAIAQAGLSQAILAAAANEVSAVREAVDSFLGEMRGDTRDAATWIHSARKSARIASRLRALRELANAGTPEATAALAEVVVSDPAPEARVLAAVALANCKERWLSIPALARALMDPAPEVAHEAARIFSAISTEDKPDRRPSDRPPDSNGSLRRTTGRRDQRATLAG